MLGAGSVESLAHSSSTGPCVPASEAGAGSQGLDQWLEGTCLQLLFCGNMLTVEHLKGTFLGYGDTQKSKLQGEAAFAAGPAT